MSFSQFREAMDQYRQDIKEGKVRTHINEQKINRCLNCLTVGAHPNFSGCCGPICQKAYFEKSMEDRKNLFLSTWTSPT